MNENYTNLRPGNAMLGSGIQVFIFDYDATRAVELLMNREQKDHKTELCPYCGSDQIEMRPNINRLKYYFYLIISLLMASPVGRVNSSFYCKKCNRDV
jgi:hypothetical protein